MTSLPGATHPMSRFTEHFSIEVHPEDLEREWPRGHQNEPSSSRGLTAGSKPRAELNVPEDLESLQGHPSLGGGTTSPFMGTIFDSRAGEEGSMGTLALLPLDSRNTAEKGGSSPATYSSPGRALPRRKQEKRRVTRRTILLILLGLALLGNLIYLNVRVGELTKKSIPSPPSPTLAPIDPSPAAVAECISQFTIDAPSNPSAYPCSTCLPILSKVTNNSDVAIAAQFCGLRAFLESTSTTGQTALSNGGWGKDLRVCIWSGVSCSESGFVTSLQLTFPAVPALVPTEISAVSRLQFLQVIGDGNYPAGALPDSFRNLTSLTTLHLESTAITTMPDNLFSLLTKVTSLTLIANPQFTGNLSSILNLPLQSLVLRNQTLENPIDRLAGSQSLHSSLVVLDLSSNSISGSIPASISSLASLTQLHLDNNNLGQAVPNAFPHLLQSLTISNNTNLSGTMPSDLCSSTSLKECDLRGTSVNETNGCGVCQF